MGDALASAEVTQALGLEPDRALDKGQVRSPRVDPRTGKPLVQRTGVWSISSKRLTTTSNQRHLSFLLDKLEPSADALRDVMARQGLEADFFCYWESASGDGGPVLSPGVLRRIAELGASLGYDFYGPCRDDDQPVGSPGAGQPGGENDS